MKKAISIFAAAALIFEVGAAYAAEFPVFLTELNFGEMVMGDDIQSFDGGELYEWEGEKNTTVNAVDEDGNYILSAENSGGKATVNANLGKELFLSTSPKGTLYWDFEDTVTFEDDNHGVDAIDSKGNVTGDFIDKIAYGEDVASPDENVTEVVGKWTGVNYNPGEHWRINPVYTPIENVLTYNNIVRLGGTLTGSGVSYGVPKDADPASGSDQVCVVRRDGLNEDGARARMLGIRVKLSKDLIEAGKTYNLSYHIANNGITGSESAKQMLMYAAFKPFDENDNISIKTGSTNDMQWLDFSKYLKTTDGKTGVQRYWQRVETTIELNESDFDENGYTVLYLLASGWLDSLKTHPTQVNGPVAGEYVYFDNISITPVTETVNDNTFSFNCKVKGNSGDKVNLSLDLDDSRSLLKETVTLKNDGWNSISGSFAMSEADEYVVGDNHGDIKDCNDGRVKLAISSDAEKLAIDDVLFMKNINESFNKYGGRKMLVAGELYNTDENVTYAKLDAAMRDGGSEHSVTDNSITLTKGANSFITYIQLPESSELSEDSYLEYKLTTEKGGLLSENVGFERFFANGVNIMRESADEFAEILKLFGKGTYLVEFDVSDSEEGDKITVSCSGGSTSIIADGDGSYQAELDIDKVAENAELVISAETAQISNITMKKTADF